MRGARFGAAACPHARPPRYLAFAPAVLAPAVLALAVLALTVLAGRPAAAASPDAETAQALNARAVVDASLQRYRAASAQVDAGLAALSKAFAAAAGAELDSVQALARQRAARAQRQQLVRAVYAGGGPVALAGSVLGSRSPDDALWRASMAEQVMATILAESGDQVRRRAGLAASARYRARQASDAASAQAAALSLVQSRANEADLALAQARQALAALDARARRAAAARAAAQQLAAAQAAAASARRSALGPVTALGIPAQYERDYRAAAPTCPGLDWTLLAAIGQVESGHGRNNGPSSAGALGPMQFLPATFAGYAVDGDRDGRLDISAPADAIFTAAHYLCVAGTPAGGLATAAGVHAAVFAYNHAEWYVDLVLAAQQAISQRAAARS